jgi:uroporphyrinogen-III synthase
MASGNLNGMKVLALESRRAAEIAKLIRTYGGDPVVAPAMREVPLESNQEALEFGRRLLNGEFEGVIFTTGVGVRRLMEILSACYDRASIVESLRRVKLVARGPKSSAALRELGLPVVATAPEPSTWHELIGAVAGAFGPSPMGMRVAVQEYGTPNPELLQALSALGIECTRVPVYQWSLPEDLEPLRNAVRLIAEGKLDVVVFLTAIQAVHLFQVAEGMGLALPMRAGLQRAVVLSIGPSTSEELRRHGIEPDLEPSHPKMGILMHEAAECAAGLLERKRGAAARSETAGSQHDAAGTDPEARPNTRQLSAIQIMHDIGRRMATSDPLHAVLNQLVNLIETLLSCDSCFIYVLEANQLVLRASKNPHPDVVDRLGLKLGQGITGWVAERREPVAINSGALRDPRFEAFKDLPEDTFEAFLSVPILARGGLVGVINVQHRQSHHYTPWEVQTIATVGFLVGAEIEMARLEGERDALSGQLESRKVIERAKGLLQRDHSISEEEAYRMMQKESRRRRKTMREIAEAVLLSEELRRAAGLKQV